MSLYRIRELVRVLVRVLVIITWRPLVEVAWLLSDPPAAVFDWLAW